MRFFWLAIGHTCLGLALAGLFLPILPTVPFLLAAVGAYERSSPRFRQWIEEHPKLGPLLKNWRQSGSIPLKAKIIASLMLTASMTIIMLQVENRWVANGVIIILLVIAAYIWSRPSTKRPPETKAEQTR